MPTSWKAENSPRWGCLSRGQLRAYWGWLRHSGYFFKKWLPSSFCSSFSSSSSLPANDCWGPWQPDAMSSICSHLIRGRTLHWAHHPLRFTNERTVTWNDEIHPTFQCQWAEGSQNERAVFLKDGILNLEPGDLDLSLPIISLTLKHRTCCYPTQINTIQINNRYR